MYDLRVVTYGPAGGCYRKCELLGFEPDITEATAVKAADELARKTGHCFAVFEGERRVHETAPYYAAQNLPREEDL